MSQRIMVFLSNLAAQADPPSMVELDRQQMLALHEEYTRSVDGRLPDFIRDAPLRYEGLLLCQPQTHIPWTLEELGI